MLPLWEIDALRTALLEAVDLAVADEVAEGYECLRSGLRRAQALRDAGEPWGKELVHRYEQALDVYTSRYVPQHADVLASYIS
jgi:hypothetical protein